MSIICPTRSRRPSLRSWPGWPKPNIASKNVFSEARAKRAWPTMRCAIGRAGSIIKRFRSWQRGFWSKKPSGGKKWTPAMTLPQIRQGIAMILREASQCDTRAHLLDACQKRLRRNELARFYHWKVKFRRTQYPHHKNQHIPEKSGITSPMQSIHPNVNSISDLATGNGNDATPFSQQRVMLTKQTYIELTWKANYWQAQHARSVEREAALTAQVASLEATIRDLTQRLYGTKSEKSAGSEDVAESKPSRPRQRGQQPGSKGHGRSDRSALLVVPEVHDLSPAQACCPACGEAFAPFPGAEESTIIEVQVQAHLRRIQRRRYHKTCGCPQVPGLVTAPPAPRVIPKSPLGVSVWTTVLLDKYLYGRPTYRLCEQLKHHGLPLSQGTLTKGLQTIAVLFEPVMLKLYERQMSEKLFHGDETRWEVFEEVEGKTGHRWYLWVMQSASVVFYRMAPGRGADVPKAHFAKLHKDLVDVVLVCDRYSAYKCLAKDCDNLILAFCWAHVRRDFLKAARSWPELKSWMFVWIEDIRALYRLNAARLEVWDETLPLALQSSAFAERHHDLETKLSQMRACYQAHLQ